MARSRANSVCAFTLIELILVLAIIAIISSIAIPAVANFEKHQRVSETADDIVALARWARTQAIGNGVSYRLNFSPGDAHYWLTVQNGASYENIFQASQSGIVGTQTTKFDTLGEQIGGQFSAPNGVSLICNIPPQPDGQYVEFRPTGRGEPGTVIVKDALGQVIEIGSLSATEEYHVLSADEKQMESTVLPTAPHAAAR